jgi:hypothetical protein
MTDLRIPNRTPEEAQRAVDERDRRHDRWRGWWFCDFGNRPRNLLDAAQEQESKNDG